MAKHCHILLILVILAGCSKIEVATQDPRPASQSPSSVSYPVKLTSVQLPNPIRIHERVISGGLPTGDAAFEELSRLGVKTVISVDGMTPDVATASKYGLRYVHLPHGYNGIPTHRVKELAKAVRELDGPIYIHCHHGKHRSPAAASVACVSAGLIPPSQALSILKMAETSTNYRGLFQAAEAARPMDAQELDRLMVEFLAVREIPALAEAMVHLEHADEKLQLIATAGWKTPTDHADLEPAHEALLVRELFTELLRTKDSGKYPDDFQEWLRDSESAANELEAELRSWQTQPNATVPLKIEQLSARLSANCKGCHVKYRDVPLILASQELNPLTKR
jgi:protein tyrosine phosphatase (PTP) superfamily phosphohydrolase (DUF442 family)